MTTGYYKIADTIIEIISQHSYIHNMCKNYSIQEQPPDITIETDNSDIEYEREMATEDGYPDGYLESLSVHRKLAEQMIGRNVILFHGSAIAVDGEAYIFTAKSGTGKSTHARLWRQKFGGRAVMVNDDKPMLKIESTGVKVCGTPWNGKHHLDTNTEIPLQAICIIHQAAQNHIEQVTFEEALPTLLQQTYRPTGDTDMEKLLELIDNMAEIIPIYKMGCNMNPEAADVAWEAMARH
jgi:hypothetical protein